jgi:hypothetical protein
MALILVNQLQLEYSSLSFERRQEAGRPTPDPGMVLMP